MDESGLSNTKRRRESSDPSPQKGNGAGRPPVGGRYPSAAIQDTHVRGCADASASGASDVAGPPALFMQPAPRVHPITAHIPRSHRILTGRRASTSDWGRCQSTTKPPAISSIRGRGRTQATTTSSSSTRSPIPGAASSGARGRTRGGGRASGDRGGRNMRFRALASAWLLAAAGWQMGAWAFLLARPAGRSWRRTAAVRDGVCAVGVGPLPPAAAPSVNQSNG